VPITDNDFQLIIMRSILEIKFKALRMVSPYLITVTRNLKPVMRHLKKHIDNTGILIISWFNHQLAKHCWDVIKTTQISASIILIE